ncbi:MAG: hypothetical protein JW910_18750 [Anaerolineae bacterium]|nr:hypothetical protein [Anaerolineae bacterium]
MESYEIEVVAPGRIYVRVQGRLSPFHSEELRLALNKRLQANGDYLLLLVNLEKGDPNDSSMLLSFHVLFRQYPGVTAAFASAPPIVARSLDVMARAIGAEGRIRCFANETAANAWLDAHAPGRC